MPSPESFSGLAITTVIHLKAVMVQQTLGLWKRSDLLAAIPPLPPLPSGMRCRSVGSRDPLQLATPTPTPSDRLGRRQEVDCLRAHSALWVTQGALVTALGAHLNSKTNQAVTFTLVAVAAFASPIPPMPGEIPSLLGRFKVVIQLRMGLTLLIHKTVAAWLGADAHQEGGTAVLSSFW